MNLPKRRVFWPVSVRVSQTHHIRLRNVQSADFEPLENLLENKASDRDLAVGVLQHQISSKLLSDKDAIAAWSDKFLLYAVRRWCAKSPMVRMKNQEALSFGEVYQDFLSTPSFKGFGETLDRYLELRQDQVVDRYSREYIYRTLGAIPDFTKAIDAFRNSYWDSYKSLGLDHRVLDQLRYVSSSKHGLSNLGSLFNNIEKSGVFDTVSNLASVVAKAALSTNLAHQQVGEALRVVNATAIPKSFDLPIIPSSRWLSNLENYQTSSLKTSHLLSHISRASGFENILNPSHGKVLDFGQMSRIGHLFSEVLNPRLDLDRYLRGSLGQPSWLNDRRAAEALQSFRNVSWQTLEVIRERAWRHQVVDQAHDVLQDSGYGFLAGFVRFTTAEVIISYPQGNRSGGITKRFLKVTTSEDFLRYMELVVRSSTAGERRWKAIEQALKAHVNGDYYNSTPALFSIFEGLVNDCLRKHRLSFERGRKTSAKKRDGTIVRGSNGKYVDLGGLDAKLRHLGTEGQGLTVIASYVEEWVPKKRNRVLHGNQTAYGKADLSIKMVLLVLLFAHELTDANHRFLM